MFEDLVQIRFIVCLSKLCATGKGSRVKGHGIMGNVVIGHVIIEISLR